MKSVTLIQGTIFAQHLEKILTERGKIVRGWEFSFMLQRILNLQYSEISSQTGEGEFIGYPVKKLLAATISSTR